ncbi:MAG: FAD-binding protein, partial [Pseudomonadota bacterium]
MIDVLIAGGGNAALCAAICAARGGARVLVVEAAPKPMRGGNTRHTRNCRVAHDEGNGILTGPYPVAEYLDDLMRVTDGRTDEDLAQLTLERSKEIWDFLEAQGVRFQPSLGGTLSLGRTNAFFLGGGRSMLNALYRTAEDLGVSFRYGTRVASLAIEDGFFTDATLETGWEGNAPATEALAARVFVAAAGGFEANIDWLKEGWGDAAENFLVRGTPYNTGGILRLLLDAGADRVGTADQCHAVAVDGRAPKFDGGIVTRLDCVPFGIV